MSITDRLFPEPLLAIESSCDETAIAVLESLEIRANVISSQIDLHAKTGGVVPEVAARAHVESILPVLDEALVASGRTIADIRAIAVANRPGLVGSLSIGVTAAKALAYAHGLPLVGVHHLEGHLLSTLFAKPELAFPHLCLLVSGGHTELVIVRDLGEYELIGETRDDAAGEAFDKSARLLGFPYPGGRALSDSGVGGDPKRYALPRGLEKEETYDFSFSGLKTAVLRLVQSEGSRLDSRDAAASIEESIVSVLVERALKAAIEYRLGAITIAGGVAANRSLRERLSEGCLREGLRFVAAPLELCTDNAAMIGLAGSFRLARGERDGIEMDCMANASLPGLET